MTYNSVLLSIVVLLTPTGGCASPSVPRAAVDATVSLHLGQSASLADNALRLRFDDVVSDSRCPSDEQCVRAGEAEVKVTVTYHGKSSSYTLFAGGSPTSAVHEGFTIELLRLEPYPKGSRAIPREDYIASFRVRNGA